jgi:DNA repair exonuclease SbcCD nuclease subunit
MIKKVVHLSDIHFRTFQMREEFEYVCNEFFKMIKEDLSDYNYDECRIVIAGDIVHQKITISNEQILMMSNFLKKCAEQAPTVIIAGNHDLLENNKDRVDSITPIIELLNNPNIHYLKESKCYPDDNIVWCVYSIFDDNKRPDIESFKNENKGKKYKYVGLYHAPINTAKTAMGFEFEDAENISIFNGLDCVMMGDIHMRSFFEIKGGGVAAYPSSLLQNNYGETVKNHGYLLWDIPSFEYEERDIDSPYGLYTFNIQSISDLENENESLMNFQ